VIELSGWALALVAAAAFVVGVAKTSVGGFAAIAVAVFASVMPAKESTAAVLLLLITGDVVAVARYRHSADWTLLRRLLPSVLPGVALGAAFLWVVSDTVLRRTIGGLLFVMVAVHLWQRRRQGSGVPAGVGGVSDGVQGVRAGVEGVPGGVGGIPGGSGGADRASRAEHPLAAVAAGVAAGFTTMTANAAGAVMTLYLLAMRVEKQRFIGTGAWFFLIVNVSKVPFSAGLGLFPESTLRLTALLVPVVLAGTWLGIRLVGRIGQRTFERLALAGSAVAALSLLMR